jgi:hypothetical protein
MKLKNTMPKRSPMYATHLPFVVMKSLTEEVLVQARSNEGERLLAELHCKLRFDH